MPAAAPKKRKAPRPAHPQPDALDARVLNRTWLARQWLARRLKKPLEGALDHFVGLQAQVPNNPYVALWSRLSAFKPERLSQLLASGQCVRGTSLRTTLHFSTALDFARIRPLLEPVFVRALHTASPYGKRLSGLSIERVTQLGRELLRERPRTLAELRPELAAAFPGYDVQALSYAVHYTLPIVQLPPRGLWQQGGQPVCAEFTSGHAVEAHELSVERLLLRYLAACGPASVTDAQTWSGLTRLREVFERLRPKLRSYRAPSGVELFDLADAKLARADSPAPVRFLPEYDNALLGLADRSRFLDPKARSYAARDNEGFGTLLVDGTLRGVWKVRVEAERRTDLRVHLLARLSRVQRGEVEVEAHALRAFLTGGAPGAVRFVERL